MGRRSLSGRLLGLLVGSVFSLVFKYIIPILFNIFLALIKTVGKMFDFLPQKWWVSPLSFAVSVGLIRLSQGHQGSALISQAGLGVFTFFFVYSANYFLKSVSSFGGIDPAALDGEIFYKSRRWRTVRYKFLKTAEKKCVLCGTTRGPFHVDHIKPRSKYPALALKIDNLQVLCEPCNIGKGVDDTGITDFRKKRA
jgi:hypothetical protein